MTKTRTRSGVKGSKGRDIDTAASVPKRRRTLVEDEIDVEISGAHNGDEDLEVIRPDDDQFIDELDSVDDEDSLEKVGIRDLDVRFPKLANRTSPAALVNAMASLTSKQRDEVNEMGFGQLFHLQIKKIPTRMAFWVLDNFDARRSEINIQDGRRLHIEAIDVHRVFGFPNGSVSIQRKKKFDTCDTLNSWVKIFEKKNGSNIVAKNVVTEMMKLKHGGEVFRRHFIVLLTACLVETTSNGYIAPQILSCLGDLTRVAEFNWCDFLIKAWVQHKIMWEKNKNKHFSGPILFLTAFYVDRVVLYSRTVCREFPTVKNWTHLLMKQRENSEIKSGGFGGGYPREAITVMLRNNMSKADYADYGIKLPIDFKTDVEKEKDKDGCVDEFAEKFIQKAKLFAITMVEIIAMVDSAPQHMAEPLKLKKIVDASLQLFGRGNYTESSSWQSPVQTQFIETQTDDEFWGKPEIIAMIEEIETAMNKRNDFIKNLPDGPSFSLGITQDEFGDLGKEIGNFDISLENDHEEETPLVMSCRQGRGVVINENTNVRDKRPDTHSLQDQRMVVLPKEGALPEPILEEIDQERMKRLVAKGKRKDVNPLLSIASELGKENDATALSNAMELTQAKVTMQDGKKDDFVHGQIMVKSQLKLVHPEKIVGPVTHKMERRNKADLKKTGKLMSPFVKRSVDISSKYSQNEKYLWYWIFYNEEANLEDILFANYGVQITRGDMLTMRPNVEINSSILDAWSCILNNKELGRSSDSPLRFFASTKPCCFQLDELKGPSDSVILRERFMRNLDYDIKQTKGLKLSDIDLFLFPVYEREHYQLVCFNVKKFRVDVIDNKIPSGGLNMGTFVSVPLLLSELFKEYLRDKGMRGKAAALARAEISRPDLPWRGNHNNSDCGIYVMRHMETYMGDGLKNWKCGLRTKCDALLKKMRVKYCAEILSAGINAHKLRNEEDASFHYRLSCEDVPINFEKLLQNK